MRVLMLEPGQDARMEEIPSDPAQLERILGGPAEITAPFESGILLVMLRDQRGQRPNRLIGSRKVYGRCLAERSIPARIGRPSGSTAGALPGQDGPLPSGVISGASGSC